MAISTAVAPSAVARVLGIETIFRNLRGGNVLFLPQRIAVVGQGTSAADYSTDKFQVTSAEQAGSRYGFGSPIHLAVRQLFPANGDGVGTIPVTVYPLEEDTGATAASGDITPSGPATENGTVRVLVNNIQSQPITIEDGDTDTEIAPKIESAINAVLAMPVTATAATGVVTIESKWKGDSANDIHAEIEGAVDGVTFSVTQPTGGATNPDVQPALDAVGNVWETMVLNCLEIADETALDKFQTWGDGRWGALTRRPAVVFTGVIDSTVSNATAVSSTRTDDRVNAQLVSPGSNDLPLAVAARQLARIAVTANENPPRDYGSQPATGLVPGSDGAQWDYSQRDQAVKAGSSTVEVRDGVVTVSDVVTFYNPEGESIPPYRFVVDIVRLQNILFNMDLLFAVPEWDGAPLIPDDQPTVNRDAKKPKDARGALAGLADSLGDNAIISDPERTKTNTQVEIDSQNPKRLNGVFPVQLSGNTNILSLDLEFGFFFG